MWSEPKYEDNVIKGFEDKWDEIQDHWVRLENLRNTVRDTQLYKMLETFGHHFEEVYDEGRLAEGTAAFLSNAWQPIQARAVEHFREEKQREQLEKFGILFDDFKSQEPLYDIIIAHPS